MKKLKMSLIMCTINRDIEVDKFLESLERQNYKNLELIVVDQNKDNRVSDIIEKYTEKICIKYIKSNQKGLSLNRNLAMEYVTGDIIAFPDDDCIYTYNQLNKINEVMNDKEYDSISIKVTNSLNNGVLIQEKLKSGFINKRDVFEKTCSISIFIKKEVVDCIGKFNEKMGLGTQSDLNGSEDWEYALRILDEPFNMYYEHGIEVMHPYKPVDKSMQNKYTEQRFLSHGATISHLSNKYKLGILFKVKNIVRAYLVMGYYKYIRNDMYMYNLKKIFISGIKKYWNS